jgi:hypothetical protein
MYIKNQKPQRLGEVIQLNRIYQAGSGSTSFTTMTDTLASETLGDLDNPATPWAHPATSARIGTGS